MRELPGNTRVNRIARWLSQHNAPICTRLALEMQGEDELVVIGQWEREPPKPWEALEVAKAVDETLQAIVEEMEVKVRAKLIVYTDTGKPWITLLLKSEPEGGSTSFDGNNLAFLQQTQRHLEGVMVNTFRKDERLFDKSLEMLTTIVGLVNAREGRSAALETALATLRDENARLNAENITAQTIAEDAINAQEEAASAVEAAKKGSNDDGKVAEIFMKALQSGPQDPPRKKKPRPEKEGDIDAT